MKEEDSCALERKEFIKASNVGETRWHKDSKERKRDREVGNEVARVRAQNDELLRRNHSYFKPKCRSMNMLALR